MPLANTSPKILLLGGSGQVGTHLKGYLSQLGKLIVPNRSSIDFSRIDKIEDYLKCVSPHIIVNAAAYTNVSAAEKEKKNAFIINSFAPEIVAQFAAKNNVFLIHYSTDYVFDGNKDSAYEETDTPKPLNVYGESKLDGERRIQNSGCDFLILRTSWVFSLVGKNFCKSILDMAKKNKELRVVCDQFGAPTHAELIASASFNAIKQNLKCEESKKNKGLYHLTSKGRVSWHELAFYLVQNAKIKNAKFNCRLENIQSTFSNNIDGGLIRPSNSQLSCKKFEQDFGIKLPAWNIHVDEFINQWVRAYENET